jgi:radical SAM superfamily enzyme YgiQ (UPF0313 family)
MRVTLVSFYEDRRWSQYPAAHSLAAMRLGAYLRKHRPGWDVELLAFEMGAPASDVAAAVAARPPDIVGFSAYIWTREKARLTCVELASCAPEALLVVGGPETNSMDYGEWPADSVFVAGPGEDALLWIGDLVERSPRAAVLEAVAGAPFALLTATSPRQDVIARDKARQKSHALPEGLPLYSDETDGMFGNLSPGRAFVWYETARGCIYTCSYCGHNTLPFFATFGDDFVRREIRSLGERRVQEAFVIDPILGGKPARGKKVLRALQELAPEVRVRAYMRPEFLDEELVDVLAATNLVELLMGIQTTNPNVPEHVRTNDFERIKAYLPALSSRGVPWRTELITGLPGDTMSGLRESLRFAIDELRPTTLYAYPLTAIPETKIHAMLDRTGDRFWIKADKRLRVIASSSYTEKEMVEMLLYSGAATSLYTFERSHGRAPSYADVDRIVMDYLPVAPGRHLVVFQGHDMAAGQAAWAEILAAPRA